MKTIQEIKTKLEQLNAAADSSDSVKPRAIIDAVQGVLAVVEEHEARLDAGVPLVGAPHRPSAARPDDDEDVEAKKKAPAHGAAHGHHRTASKSK